MRIQTFAISAWGRSRFGFYTKKDNDTIIFTNTSSRLAREIFTLAHEIKEQEANYFAVNLLMPSDEVEKFLDLEIENFSKDTVSAMDIARIMSEFHVSFETALNQLENLKKIGCAERIKLDNARNEMRVGNLLHSVGGNSRLNQASGVTSLPYEYLDYVIYNYNHKAIPQETLEKVLACYALSIDDISDKLVASDQEEDDLDDLIGGL